MSTITVKVSAIRQVSLPKSICDKLKIKPGDRLIVTLRNGKITLQQSEIVAKTRTASLSRYKRGTK